MIQAIDGPDGIVYSSKDMQKVATGVGILQPSPSSDTPEVVSCRWGVTEIRNLKVQGT
jgi:hypothetical protein